MAADSALWRQIYLTHLSHLRGHLKFLVGLSTTPAAKGKLEKRSYILLFPRTILPPPLIYNTNKTTEIVTAKKAINDAKAAAVIAGLVRPTTTTTTTTEVAPKRKTRPSVTFAEHPEVLGPKKAKTGHARAGAGRGKPSAEMLGRLRSRLGKHGVEVEEGVVEKVVKKGRLAYLQVGDPEGEYLDDEEMRAGLEGEGEAETTTTDTPSASASVSGSKRGKTTTEPSAKKARTTASVPSVFANPAVTPSASSKRAKTSSTASPSSAPTTTTTETPAASSSSAKKTKTDTTPAKDKSAPTTTTTTTPSAPKNTDATTPSTSDTAKKTKTKTPGTRSASKSAKAKQSHAKSPKHAVVVDGAGDVGSREAKKQKKEHYEFVGGRWSRYEGYE